MQISKIMPVNFCSKKDKSDINNKITKMPENPQIEADSQKALESMGRADVIKMPVKKTPPKDIAQICDKFILANKDLINKIRTGEIKSSLFSADEWIERLSEQNENYEILKKLDSDKFLKRIKPRYYRDTAIFIDDSRLLEECVEALNGADEKVLSKISYPLLQFLVQSPHLAERLYQLEKTNDRILENMTKDAVMDILLDNNVCSDSTRTLKQFLGEEESKPAEIVDFHKKDSDV